MNGSAFRLVYRVSALFAGTPVVVETPDEDGSDHTADIEWLRRNV